MKKLFWERFAFMYDAAMKKGDEADREAAEYIVGFLPKSCHMLEAACGTGRFTCEIAPKIQHVTCCDYALNMVNETKKKARARNIYNIDCFVQDIHALSFDDRFFDVVMAANVLHLLPEPGRAIRELKRVVNPEGFLIFPNFVNQESTNKCFLNLINLLGFRAQNEWNREQFLKFLSTNGLEIVDYKMFLSRQPLCVAITKITKKNMSIS